MTAPAPASSPTSPSAAVIAIDDGNVSALAEAIARVIGDAAECGCIDAEMIAAHVAGLHRGTPLARVQQSARGVRKDFQLVIR